MLQLLENCRIHGARKALVQEGDEISYNQLLMESSSFASKLLDGRENLDEARIAFLADPGLDYLKVLLGVWMAGGIAVPLCLSHPRNALAYTINDCSATMLVYSPDFTPIAAELHQHANLKILDTSTISIESAQLPAISTNQRAMILYTSGTTGKPKGVVSTHSSIESQIRSLVDAWKWNPEDHILNVLPLHHVHGIINVTCCALWSGAKITFHPKFSAEAVFQEFQERSVTLFMAVPTIYYKLISFMDELDDTQKANLYAIMGKLRLMVSGSAALPVSVMNQWKELSGHSLLERYGMTEIGMAISNPYEGERVAGHIGQALPGVHVRIANEDNIPVDREAGEIQVKGPTVFKEYWNRPKETAESFTVDGWFKTGDIAILDSGSYKILGRKSVDIIKSGGYKLSALEIEEVLRSHNSIADCGVVGIPDEEWGEVVGACLVLREPIRDFNVLTHWMKKSLPSYKIPKQYLVVDDLPRNSMGKVTKVRIKEMFANSIDNSSL